MLNKNKGNQINPLTNDRLKNSVLVYKVMPLFRNSKRGSFTHRKAINQLSEQHGMKMCTPEGKRPNWYKCYIYFRRGLGSSISLQHGLLGKRGCYRATWLSNKRCAKTIPSVTGTELRQCTFHLFSMKSLSALLSTADSLWASKRLPCTKHKIQQSNINYTPHV